MSKVQKTLLNNARLLPLLKLADTYLIKMENGEWSGNPGTYKEIKKSVEHSKSEMAKQSRQRRKTMTIEYIPEIERRGIIGEHNTREV